MFLAAFTSALQLYRQAVQAKTAWLLRLSLATWPHELQHWLVNGGQRGAYRDAPVHAHQLVPGPLMGPGIAAKATGQRPARSSFTRNDLAGGTGRDQRNRTRPALGM
jgi:hypothetical protein